MLRRATKTFYDGEPEAVKSWRHYANPINQALMEKWKNGEPQTKDRLGMAAGINRRSANTQHQVPNSGSNRPTSWRTI